MRSCVRALVVSGIGGGVSHRDAAARGSRACGRRVDQRVSVLNVVFARVVTRRHVRFRPEVLRCSRCCCVSTSVVLPSHADVVRVRVR